MANVIYNPSRFNGVILRMKNPRATANIFPKGKVTLTGCKDEAELKISAKKVMRYVRRAGFKARIKKFAIQNVVGTVNINYPLKLTDLASIFESTKVQYEPELFPALLWKHNNIRMVIFHTGKINLMGGTSKMEIEEAYEYITSALELFKVLS